MKKSTLLLTVFIITSCLFSQIIHIPADYVDIQDGINASSNGDTVLVAPGTYYENLSFNGKAIMLASHFLTTGDTSFISKTVLTDDDSILSGGIVDFTNNESHSSILYGFTMKESFSEFHGGAIVCFNSSPTLLHLIITDNHAGSKGGGIYCGDSSSPIIAWVELTKNTSTYQGGGLALEQNSNPVLHHVKISENISWISTGGGMWCNENCNPILDNVVFQDDSCAAGGPAISSSLCNLKLRNVLISDNIVFTSLGFAGSIIFYGANTLELINVTILGTTESYGGAVYAWGGSIIRLTNCIFYGNYPGELCFSSDGPKNHLYVSYSNVEGGEMGVYHGYNTYQHWLEGNIDSHPGFMNGGEEPYQLAWYSPCIDAGKADTSGLHLPGGDLLGNIRVWDGNGDGTAVIDMGAYEFDSHASGITNPGYEWSKNNRPELFPNPSRGILNIRFSTEIPQVAIIDLFSVTDGFKTNLAKKPCQSGQQQFQFNLSTFQSGVYIVKITLENQLLEGDFILID